ncbi:MAG: response regulator, partial [Planctomycetaceae bacterium]|nr:response regulator [Planctomycetaceae bacterium]
MTIVDTGNFLSAENASAANHLPSPTTTFAEPAAEFAQATGEVAQRAAILFVDDELNIVRACRRILRSTGAEIVTTTSAKEAVELAKNRSFSVVVSDQRMPEMEGTELLEQIRQIQPDSVRIILTGYADISAAVDAINRGAVFRFLNKPWDDDGLRSVIRQAVAQYDLVRENRRLHELTQTQNEELRDLNEMLEYRVGERTREVTELSCRLDATLKGALKILTQLMDVNSSVIGHHSRRVADLAVRIGQELNLEQESLRQLEVAALLHDIGKLMLPGHLLKKPRGQQSREERLQMQQHSAKGEAVLRAIPHLEAAASYVRSHHEAVNGAGYPDQLKGAEIPLGARIIAAADAWDKKLNNRDNFHQQTPAEVMSYIHAHAGDLFDGNVVQALERVLRGDEECARPAEDVVDVNPADLKPGMVLAADIRSDSGALLLPADAVLTQEGIRRLRQMDHIDLLTG